MNSPERAPSEHPRWIAYAVFGTTAIVVYYLLPRSSVVQGVLLTAVNASASVAALRAAAGTKGWTKVVWGSLAAAMLLATLANGPYYAWPHITGDPIPFPCPVDILWLLTYPSFAVALFALAKQRRHEDRRGDTLDAALVVAGAATAMWVFIIHPIATTPGLGELARVVSVAYPVGDLLVFAMLVRLLVSGLRRSGSSRLLLGSFAALLIADLTYSIGLQTGTYHLGGPADGMWMASYVLIGVAALHPSRDTFPRPASGRAAVTKGRFAFLCIAALTGPAMLVIKPEEVPGIAAVSALSFLLVLARFTLLNRRLEVVGSELELRATTDSLTGLANRAELYNVIESSIARGREGGLFFIDLDEFKSVNDLAGHSAGDTILAEVAHRLRSVVRSTDVVARLGGDEFAVFASDPDCAPLLGPRLIDVLGRELSLPGRTFTLGGSIGFVRAQPGMELERLVQDADIAMYAPKREGKNRMVVFDDAMYAEIVERSDIESEMAGAVDRGEILVAYQPIVELEGGVAIGVEALARWKHPRLGDIRPDRFIPIAEQTGAIVQLGRSVLETAFRDLARIDEVSRLALGLSVNVSTVQLHRSSFAEEVAQALQDAGIEANRLTLEVTESAMVEERGDAVRQLHLLRSLGVQIAIDDFGTGYSSLAYLGRLPVGEVKIDRAFVEGVDHSIEDASVARAILRISDAMGLRCVAEGVERREQVAPLLAAGCELAQGFLFARPMPIEDLEAFLGRRSAEVNNRSSLVAAPSSIRASSIATAGG